MENEAAGMAAALRGDPGLRREDTLSGMNSWLVYSEKLSHDIRPSLSGKLQSPLRRYLRDDEAVVKRPDPLECPNSKVSFVKVLKRRPILAQRTLEVSDVRAHPGRGAGVLFVSDIGGLLP
jgi:hypothetical protein